MLVKLICHILMRNLLSANLRIRGPLSKNSSITSFIHSAMEEKHDKSPLTDWKRCSDIWVLKKFNENAWFDWKLIMESWGPLIIDVEIPDRFPSLCNTHPISYLSEKVLLQIFWLRCVHCLRIALITNGTIMQ